jgi:choline dehydrogenase
MLSGIGDKPTLSKLGIDTILHLPDVGQNGTDHVLLPNVIQVNTNETFNQYLAPDAIDSQIALWQNNHQGPLSYTLTNLMGWHRLPSNDPVLKKYGDPTPGPTSAHYEIIFSPGFGAAGETAPTTGKYNTIFTNVISPTSRGNVTLKSSNPFDAPIINPNFLATDTDIHIIVKAFQAMVKIVESKSWKGYFQGYLGSLANVKTEKQIINYARQNAGSVWHFVGTAAVSPKGAKYGVVDPDFRVKGAAGLRVVDASVLPYVPSAHTHAPVYLIAELASDAIKS